MGQSDFTHADELGVMIARPAVPRTCFITSSWSTAAGNTLASFFGGEKLQRRLAEKTCSKP